MYKEMRSENNMKIAEETGKKQLENLLDTILKTKEISDYTIEIKYK